MAIVSFQTLRRIEKEIKDHYAEVWRLEDLGGVFGLRVVASHNDKIGDILDPSHVWVDGEYTDEMLEGASAIVLGQAKYLPDESYSGYEGDRVLVINSRDFYPGEDLGEGVFPDAEVIKILDPSTW